jgi:uncharacterized protein YbjQ (UPF0145 family)
MRVTILGPLLLSVMLTGCATWSTSSVDNSAADITTSQVKKKQPSEIQVTEGDITDRSYKLIGDVSVTVNKTTVFHPDPTKEMVTEKLKEKASELGADAVVLARYGKGGMSLMSWGSLEGKGRAIKFDR